MKTAIISDIHADYGSLLSVLGDIDQCNCERIICLGDVVEGYSDDIRVVEEIRRRGIQTVKGNHDEYHDGLLPYEIEAYLRQLPEEIVERDIIYTHISPRLKKKSINSDVEAWNVFDECQYRLIFIGHLHVSVMWGQKCKTMLSARFYHIQPNRPYPLRRDDRYIICVGAISQSREILPTISYGIYDDRANTIEIRKLKIILW